MSKRYYHKVIYPPIADTLEKIDANYELINIINCPPYEIVLVFIEHGDYDIADDISIESRRNLKEYARKAQLKGGE